MSTEVAIYKPASFPAIVDQSAVSSIIEFIKDNSLDISDLTEIQVPSGKGMMFEIKELSGPKSSETVDLVIMKVHGRQKAWWAKDATVTMKEPPNCASNDAITGVGNNDMAQRPAFNGPHDCLTCPHGQWGSDRKGGKSKDCKDFALALGVRVGARMPVILKIPATSIEALKEYNKQLVDDPTICDPYKIVTRVSIAKDKSAGGIEYSKLVFKMAGKLSDDEVRASLMLRDGLAAYIQPRRYIPSSESLRGAAEQTTQDAKGTVTSRETVTHADVGDVPPSIFPQ